MFTSRRILRNATTPSTRNFLRSEIPSHVQAAPLEQQVGVAAGPAAKNFSLNRETSSLLQDWVMLAHRRPIGGGDRTPEINVKWEGFSPETITLISSALQVREWDPAGSRAKRLKKQIAASSSLSAAATTSSSETQPSATAAAASMTAPKGPRTVQRARPRTASVAPAAPAAPPSPPAPTSSSQQPAPTPPPPPPTVHGAPQPKVETAAPSSLPTTTPAPRLRAKVLLRKDPSTAAAASTSSSSSSSSSSSDSGSAAGNVTEDETPAPPITSSTTTTRRRVVRVGVASRS